MTRGELRIECLKLAHRHDREAADVVNRAKVFEAYVAEPQGEIREPDTGRMTSGKTDVTRRAK